MMRREMPAELMMPPARMNSGIASSGNLAAPENRCSGMTAGVVPPPASRATSTAAMRAKPIGTRSAERATMSPITTPVIAAPGPPGAGAR